MAQITRADDGRPFPLSPRSLSEHRVAAELRRADVKLMVNCPAAPFRETFHLHQILQINRAAASELELEQQSRARLPKQV
jgi:hypothetical protein